jgi:hypothetical protein
MSRVPQKPASRGSQKWLQLLVNRAPHLLDSALGRHLGLSPADTIAWLSPRADDGYAEYRDEAFLTKIGARPQRTPLAAFWPTRGPQWNALGRTSRGEPLLVEAKAHIPELLSPPCPAAGRTLRAIRTSLDRVKRAVSLRAAADWSTTYYQYANRLAHLYFLRTLNQVPAYLVSLYLVGDTDLRGPRTPEQWAGALELVHAQLGIVDARLHDAFGGAFVEIFIDVADITAATT